MEEEKLGKFGFNNPVNKKNKTQERYSIKIHNCYEVVDNKTQMVMGRHIAYDGDDVSARKKAEDSKKFYENTEGETYEVQ